MLSNIQWIEEAIYRGAEIDHSQVLSIYEEMKQEMFLRLIEKETFEEEDVYWFDDK